MQFTPVATIILHRPDEWREIAKWLRRQASYVAKQKDNFTEHAPLILQLPEKTKEK